MREVTTSLKTTPLAVSRIGLLLVVGFGSLLLLWARFYTTNHRLQQDPSSQADVSAAEKQAQSLLDSLEKYRVTNGLYPVTLAQLILADATDTNGYRYSARHNDWVFRSNACVEREKSLRGWVLKESKEYGQEVAAFKLDCLTGYREYQLQSPDFPHHDQTAYIDRWAYYDSSTRQWALGWCSHERRHGASVGVNGVCRWLLRRAPDPW